MTADPLVKEVYIEAMPEAVLEFLPPSIETDENGFVKTGLAVA